MTDSTLVDPRMTSAQIRNFFATLAAANPQPQTELAFASVFELLCAVLLSAQALGLQGLEGYIKTIGLYHAKARHLLQTCQMLVTQHDGQVPRTRQALEALPGVGRKTANVILNVAFGEPTMAVDTHIFRLGNRTGLAPGKTTLEVEHKLLKRIPKEFMTDAHHWLILHGRYVCQARTPRCWECAVADCCDHTPKTQHPSKP